MILLHVPVATVKAPVCVLSRGVIEQVGTLLELYENPRSLFVAGFIDSPKMNFLTGAFAKKHDAETIGIRSEHVEVVEKGGEWEGKVIHAENLGSDSYAFVEVGSDEPLIVRLPGTSHYKVSETISLAAVKGNLHRFDKNGRPMAR